MTNKPTVSLALDYDTWVRPVKSSFIRIDLPTDSVNLLNAFVKEVVEKKKDEESYKRDPINTQKRFTTGFGGEMAVGLMLGMNIMDYRVGDARHFAMGDLSTIGLPHIGVKSIEYDTKLHKFPIVHKLAIRSEIIVFKSSLSHSYLIAGLATPDVLRMFCSRDLVKDDNITKDKECFYGIPFCRSFSSYEDLAEINSLTEGWIEGNNIKTSFYVKPV